jgi:hypothetical protein
VTTLFQLAKKVTNLFQIAKEVTNLFQMGVSNQFRLTKVVDFIPYGTHSDLFQMDVSDLFSPPITLAKPRATFP